MDKTTNVNDLSDEITGDLNAARAIMDAASVLIALDHAQAEPLEGTLATGNGFADGYNLSDATLPDLLKHGVNLLESVKRKADQMVALAGAFNN